MSDIEKTEISLVGSNEFKLKTTADFLGLSLSEVVNACLYLGVYKIWIPIAQIIDELPDWDLDPEEETEKLLKIKQKYIKIIQTANKNVQKIEELEKKFNKNFSKKHFKSDTELYEAFINYIQPHLEEKRPSPPKLSKGVVKKVAPLSIEKISSVSDKNSTEKKKKEENKDYLQVLFKCFIFVIFFISPILLIVTITIVFFKYNYLILLQYQPVMLLLFGFVLALLGIVLGWISLRFIQYRQNTTEIRNLKKEFRKKRSIGRYRFWKGYRKFKEENARKKFEEGSTRWRQLLEKFIESKILKENE